MITPPMSTILTFVEGDEFIVRTYKHFDGDASRRWANTWEFHAKGAGATSDLVAAAEKFVSLERKLSLADVIFESYTIGTWAPDSHPYNPNTFLSQGLSVQGTRVDDTTNHLDRRIVLWLNRNAMSGRLGKVFLRGSLTEGDINAVAGVIQLDDAAGLATEVAAACTSAGIAEYLAGGLNEKLELSMIGLVGKGLDRTKYTRVVQSIGLHGVTIVGFNHKYYDVPGVPG